MKKKIRGEKTDRHRSTGPKRKILDIHGFRGYEEIHLGHKDWQTLINWTEKANTTRFWFLSFVIMKKQFRCTKKDWPTAIANFCSNIIVKNTILDVGSVSVQYNIWYMQELSCVWQGIKSPLSITITYVFISFSDTKGHG